MVCAPSRQRTLRLTAAALGITGLSGCLFGIDEEHDAGTVVVRNDHGESQTVTVTVTKTSDDSDDIRRHDEPPASETTPMWKRTRRFTVGPGERAVREEYVAEPGAFYVEATLPTGEGDSAWLGLYEAGVDGDSVAEDAVFVDVTEDRRVLITTTHGD
jgi:hypothetical protein